MEADAAGTIFHLVDGGSPYDRARVELLDEVTNSARRLRSIARAVRNRTEIIEIRIARRRIGPDGEEILRRDWRRCLEGIFVLVVEGFEEPGELQGFVGGQKILLREGIEPRRALGRQFVRQRGELIQLLADRRIYGSRIARCNRRPFLTLGEYKGGARPEDPDEERPIVRGSRQIHVPAHLQIAAQKILVALRCDRPVVVPSMREQEDIRVLPRLRGIDQVLARLRSRAHAALVERNDIERCFATVVQANLAVGPGGQRGPHDRLLVAMHPRTARPTPYVHRCEGMCLRLDVHRNREAFCLRSTIAQFVYCCIVKKYDRPTQ